MMKRILIDGPIKRTPDELEVTAAKLIEVSSNEGSSVALVSQNRTVAYAMLNKLLEQGVNVESVLLRDEKQFQTAHVRSYTIPSYIGRTMASMENDGIEYFIVMALSDLMPPSVVREFHGRLWNVHGSILPDYRGVGNPVKEQLRNGDEYGGVTLQFVGEEIDSGDVLIRYKVPLIYDGEPLPLQNPPRRLIDKNYKKVIFPTAAEVCAFTLENIDRIQPMPLEKLRGGSRLSPNKMVYARK